jgi:hypothetical protein
MQVRTRKREIGHFRAIRFCKHALSVQYTRTYVDGSTKISRKSESMVEGNRVIAFAYDEMIVVEASVQASMRDRSYNIRVSSLGICLEIAIAVCHWHVYLWSF